MGSSGMLGDCVPEDMFEGKEIWDSDSGSLGAHCDYDSVGSEGEFRGESDEDPTTVNKFANAGQRKLFYSETVTRDGVDGNKLTKWRCPLCSKGFKSALDVKE